MGGDAWAGAGEEGRAGVDGVVRRGRAGVRWRRSPGARWCCSSQNASSRPAEQLPQRRGVRVRRRAGALTHWRRRRRAALAAKIGDGNDRDQLASSHHEATERVFKSEFSVLGKATERSDLVRCEFLFLALRRGDALVDDQREIVSRHWHCRRSHFISDTRNS